MSEEIVCKFPCCFRHPEKNGYCIGHKIYAGESNTTAAPKQKTIAKVSEKRKGVNKEYRLIVKDMLKTNPNCEIKEVGCTGKAQGLHHKQKRLPSNITDRNNLMRACNSCNTWVENHPQEAIEKGLTISKHKNLKVK